ncbi:hypothetical protein [Pengzhenrongella frigida]|uniref:Uncharacterized protein n=1 Tax=Pengzhenrongella frigida TaxID=1259133 RepID=A0A4Q5MYP3_9MICO|nr:hypothetical protein [Cellulomonas sp. HLT2-17]RYV50786.1 hypothetical protein EUA98_11575 [Cellulomonas sp. HLT2-17]
MVEASYVTRVDLRVLEVGSSDQVSTATSLAAGGLIVRMGAEQPVHLLAGIVMGPARVTIRTLDARPDVVEAGWEDVGEVSILADGRPVFVRGPWVEHRDLRFDLVDGGTGWYRVRAHARGRDLLYDLVAEEPVEDYLLVAWPEAPAEPHTVQVTSKHGSELAATPFPWMPAAEPDPLRRAAEANLRDAARRNGLLSGE